MAQKIRGKACGSCGKPVSVSSKIGDICPHCGVKWGSENASRGTSKVRTHNTLSQKKPQKKQAPKPVKKTASPKPIVYASLTQPQLIKYLEEKLNKYAIDHMECSNVNDPLVDNGCINYLNYEIKIDSVFLIVKYNYNNKYYKLAYFPLNDFGCVTHTMPSSIGIAANNHVNYPSENDAHEYMTSYISIGFDKNREEDITYKIEKAFLALKKYYQKPINNISPTGTF